MKKRLALVVAGLVLCSMTGCGLKDIEKRFFVTAIGVDLSEDLNKPYKVTLKLAVLLPEMKAGNDQFRIVQENGATITEAIRLMNSKIDKELEFGHAKVIIFGEKLARNNIKKPMDWFNRRRDIQKVAYLAVGYPDAGSVLNIKPSSELLPGNDFILKFGQEGTNSSYILTTFLFDFNRRLTLQGLDPALPVIEAVGKKGYTINRTALFDKTKLIEILTPDETRILNELAFKSSKFEGLTQTPGVKMAISFDKLTVKHWMVTPSQGVPYIQINVKANGIVEEAENTLSVLEWNTYQIETEKTFEQRYLKILKKLQNLKVDPIGFGEDYFSRHFNRNTNLDNWQKLYPRLDFRVQAEVRILSPGSKY